MKFIRDFIRQKELRKEKEREHTISFMREMISFNVSIHNLLVAASQKKCYTCIHKYTEKKFESGGLVGAHGAGEMILKPNIQDNTNKAEIEGGIKRLKEMLEKSKKENNHKPEVNI